MPLLPNEQGGAASALPAARLGRGLWWRSMWRPPASWRRKIQAVWQEVLGRERISTQADFFTVGGNSLQARLHLWLSD